MLPLDVIRPNPFQPRKVFDQASLRELADSLRSHGVLQPIVVRPAGTGYELISGERRWKAAHLAGLSTIPAVSRPDASDREMLELALVENVQRQDLDAIERARGFRAMMDSLGITQDEVARKVGLQRASIANHLRLLELPLHIQEAVSGCSISMGHARALLALDSPKAQSQALERIVREGLSVRQVEALARSDRAKPTRAEKSGPALVPHRPWIGELEARLRERLGTKVSIQNGAGLKGQIVVEYYDRASLERICQLLAPRRELA